MRGAPVVAEELMSEVSETAKVLDAPVAESVSDVVVEETAAVVESATDSVDALEAAAEVEAEVLALAEVEAVEAVESIAEGADSADVVVEEVVEIVEADGELVEEIVVAEAVADATSIVAEAEAVVVDESGEIVEEISATDVLVAEPVAEAAEEAAEASEGAATDGGATDGSGKRVVRTLAVGQEVQGTVKRISEFGAFVDIGVGRDGLVHISELSVKRVGKVTDVITEGQQIQVWIKKLDRERNRISLTLIPPGTVTIRDLNKDDIVNGTVTRILPYGAFVDIGVGRDALLHVREMGERYIAKPEEVVKVGEQIEARIIEIQRRRGRIDLSIKGLRPEPEVEAPVVEQSSSRNEGKGGKAEAVAEPVVEENTDAFAEVEVLSPFQLALQRAQERSGVELDYNSGKGSGKSNKKEKQRREQEDIFERTLKTR